ncbi:MAG: methylenetetrahydrofolate--tRNA-(uracil(54)-C(5))-methyltransferase (FADH(2)-oxidizing) TrmFO [Christensenellales bacterium]
MKGVQMVNVIGAGLAGCEAALRLSEDGFKVRLFECKPNEMTPAHASAGLAELVCSNSLKSDLLTTASGLLKAELRQLGCRLLEAADAARVPAGSALAVDRAKFSAAVTELIAADGNIEVIHKTVADWDENEYTIIATGPLTLNELSKSIERRLGKGLHFFDAAAPIVDGASIDFTQAFTADRYGRGEGDYINCPMDKSRYEDFIDALISAECAVLKDFEKSDVFEGCMPVEVMAKRGCDTLRFGPLRPVGFSDVNGKRPYAVVQLRRENTAGESFNIVGFQTNLKFGEQERVFRMIPALKDAEFLRFGVMHRNTFINAPVTINANFQTLKYPKTFIAGQLSGVEGYVESIMSGLVAAMSVSALLKDAPPPRFPLTTIVGALCAYLETPNSAFQPMNANFGLLPSVGAGVKDKNAKKLFLSEKSLKDLKNAGF